MKTITILAIILSFTSSISNFAQNDNIEAYNTPYSLNPENMNAYDGGYFPTGIYSPVFSSMELSFINPGNVPGLAEIKIHNNRYILSVTAFEPVETGYHEKNSNKYLINYNRAVKTVNLYGEDIRSVRETKFGMFIDTSTYYSSSMSKSRSTVWVTKHHLNGELISTEIHGNYFPPSAVYNYIYNHNGLLSEVIMRNEERGYKKTELKYDNYDRIVEIETQNMHVSNILKYYTYKIKYSYYGKVEEVVKYEKVIPPDGDTITAVDTFHFFYDDAGRNTDIVATEESSGFPPTQIHINYNDKGLITYYLTITEREPFEPISSTFRPDSFAVEYSTEKLLYCVNPDKLDRILPGDTIEINWVGLLTSDFVNIEYSSDGGDNWQSIKNRIYNNGLTQWRAPVEPTFNAKFKITDADNTEIECRNKGYLIVHDPGLSYVKHEAKHFNYHTSNTGYSWFSLYNYSSRNYLTTGFLYLHDSSVHAFQPGYYQSFNFEKLDTSGLHPLFKDVSKCGYFQGFSERKDIRVRRTIFSNPDDPYIIFKTTTTNHNKFTVPELLNANRLEFSYDNNIVSTAYDAGRNLLMYKIEAYYNTSYLGLTVFSNDMAFCTAQYDTHPEVLFYSLKSYQNQLFSDPYSTIYYSGPSVSLAPDDSVTLVSAIISGNSFDEIKSNTDEALSKWNAITDADETAPSVPKHFSLSQNYPNPFNPSTTIKFNLPVYSHVRLVVYNTLGEEVAAITDREYNAGTHTLIFNASGLASGIYFYRLQCSSDGITFNKTEKMILLK